MIKQTSNTFVHLSHYAVCWLWNLPHGRQRPPRVRPRSKEEPAVHQRAPLLHQHRLPHGHLPRPTVPPGWNASCNLCRAGVRGRCNRECDDLDPTRDGSDPHGLWNPVDRLAVRHIRLLVCSSLHWLLHSLPRHQFSLDATVLRREYQHSWQGLRTC